MIRRLRALAEGKSLRAASIRSAFWTTSAFGFRSALRLGSNLILTRLLAPEAFGLMALAMVFLDGLTLLSDIGTRHSVIRSERGKDPDFLRTAWTMQVIRGFLIGAAACALAWPAAQLYDQPMLVPMLCALALSPVLTGFRSIRAVMLARELEQSRQAVIDVLAQAISVVVMIAAAIILDSVWALVLGGLTGAFLQMALTYVLMPRFQHRFQLERGAFREIVKFGRWILLSTMLSYVGGRGITSIHGALVTIQMLGFLAISKTLTMVLESLVGKLMANVAFPALSRTVRDAPERLVSVLTRIRATLVLGGVLFLGLVSWFAQPLIDLLYDPRYALAGGFLSLQALNSAFRIMGLPYKNVMLAQGKSHLHTIVTLTLAVLGIAFTLIGFSFYGPYGMVAGMGIAGLCSFAMSFSIAWREGYAVPLVDLATIGLLILAYWHALSLLDFSLVAESSL